jgi:hypothetical protein
MAKIEKEWEIYPYSTPSAEGIRNSENQERLNEIIIGALGNDPTNNVIISLVLRGGDEI